ATSSIRIGLETAHWQEGKALIFDDTLEHEVWQQSPEPHAVLFVDFLRPGPLPLRMMNRWVVRQIHDSSYIQSALKRLENWHGAITGVDATSSPSQTSPTGG